MVGAERAVAVGYSDALVHSWATPTKQPVNAPPSDSGLAETIWVKNQCPPLAGVVHAGGIPPLLQCLPVSPMMVSKEIGADWRFKAGVEDQDLPDVVGLDH